MMPETMCRPMTLARPSESNRPCLFSFDVIGVPFGGGAGVPFGKAAPAPSQNPTPILPKTFVRADGGRG